MSIPENGSSDEGSEVLNIAQMLRDLGSSDERIDGRLERVSCSVTRPVSGELSLFESLTITETSGVD